MKKNYYSLKVAKLLLSFALVTSTSLLKNNLTNAMDPAPP